MMIDGRPLSRSTQSWIAARTFGEANSSRKTAISTATGSAIAVAIPTSSAEPTSNGAIPPPGWPKSGRSLVRKPHESSPAPRLAIDQTTMPSTSTARSAATVALPSASRLTIRLRRSRRSPWRFTSAATGSLEREALDDYLREQVGQQPDHKQDRSEVEERGDLQLRDGTLVLARDPARQGVPRGEQRRADEPAGADHLRDGNRLSEGPAEAKDHRRADPGPRRGEDDAAHHLPARGPERERALLELGRDTQKELAADARHDRDNHDRQDHSGDENATRLRRAAEDRQEAERVVQPQLDVIREERAEHEDPPEPEDNARDRRERLDQRSNHEAQAPRRELAQEERDQERDQRGHGSPVEPGRSAEDVLVGIPSRVPDEREPERAQREMRAADHLVGDEADQDDRAEPGSAGDDQEQAVANAVAQAPSAAQLRHRDRAHRGAR